MFSASAYSITISSLSTDLLTSELSRIEFSELFVDRMKKTLIKLELESRKR
jgi:hypothetical protein